MANITTIEPEEENHPTTRAATVGSVMDEEDDEGVHENSRANGIDVHPQTNRRSDDSARRRTPLSASNRGTRNTTTNTNNGPRTESDASPRRRRGLIDDIPEQEKWRLIDQSGVLKAFAAPGGGQRNRSRPPKNEPDRRPVLLQAVLYTIPLSLFYCGLEVLVHQQFFEEKSVAEVAHAKLGSIAPVLAVVVYVTHRFVESNWMQYAMAVGGIAAGVRMFQLIHSTPTYGEMLLTPGLASIWLYFVAQMRLPLAVASLIGVGLIQFVILPHWLSFVPSYSLSTTTTTSSSASSSSSKGPPAAPYSSPSTYS